jgi:hypothetical protein
MKARVNPLGLLIQMVKDREHKLRGRARIDEREQMHAAGEVPPPAAVCLSCETGGGYHVDDCDEPKPTSPPATAEEVERAKAMLQGLGLLRDMPA